MLLIFSPRGGVLFFTPLGIRVPMGAYPRANIPGSFEGGLYSRGGSLWRPVVDPPRV